MAKSDINFLQELSIKQEFMPVYEFSESNIDYKKQFKCSVVCKELITHGTGNTKKEAKHNAAKNMLSLLAKNDKISLPAVVTSSVTNVPQSPAKVCNTSLNNKQFTVKHNYIGLLQEFCQQRKIPTTDIQYKLIYDEGLPHIKTFTVEVSLGLLCERGTAQCKKSAKQEAAKKLLLHLNPNVIADMDTNKIDTHDKETLEKNIQKLGTKISQCVNINKDTLPVEKLSENAKLLYLKCTNRDVMDHEINSLTLKNFHMLFKKNYSNKISYHMKEKMQIIMDKYPHEPDLMHEIRQDIEKVLKAKIQQITAHSKSQNYLICLRLSSNPCITQFGIGESKILAECCATYNLMRAILIFIN